MEKNQDEFIKTPIAIIMDMAKDELSKHVMEIMRNNNLPAGAYGICFRKCFVKSKKH